MGPFKGQSNKLWNTLKTALPSKHSDTQYPSDITPLSFNKFYTTVVVNLTRDLPYVQNIELPLKSNHPSLYSPFPRNLFLKSYFHSLLRVQLISLTLI